MKLDFDGKNWAIKIIFFLDMLFFGIAVTLWMSPYHKDIAQKIWEVFMGANGALMLLLNAEGKKGIEVPPDTDTSQVTTKQTQTLEVTTTPDPTAPAAPAE